MKQVNMYMEIVVTEVLKGIIPKPVPTFMVIVRLMVLLTPMSQNKVAMFKVAVNFQS